MKTIRVAGVLATALVLGLVSAGTSSADPVANPGQWWHSTNLGKTAGPGGIAAPLFYQPAQACFGSTGWIGANFDRSLFANQANKTRAHVHGTTTWTFWITFDPDGLGPHDYEGQVTLNVNTFVAANPNYSTSPYYQGYNEYVLRVDMTPVGGGSTIPMNWPIQIWVAWSPDYTIPNIGLGIPTCA
jgi:hypothetical protein